MTGVGAYYYIIWGIWLRYCLNGEQDTVRLSWPSLFSFPDIMRVEKPSQNGHASNGKAVGNGYANGHANGHSEVKEKI
jgi:dihydroceramidase